MNDSNPCVICGEKEVMRQTAEIAGTRWPICHTCGGVGATLLAEGALQPVRHCLHQTAMEIEAFAGEPDKYLGAFRRWLLRIVSRFGDGYYRATCPCPACKGGKKHPGAIPDLHAYFGLSRETTTETMELAVLRSMKESQRLPNEQGRDWRAVDEIARRIVENTRATAYPGIKPGGLADRARALKPRDVP